MQLIRTLILILLLASSAMAQIITHPAATAFSSGLTITQGTLTASKPMISQTATWNNGAVTFVNFFSNVTDTASVAGSLLMDLQVNAVSKFKIDKAGSVTFTGGFTLGASWGFGWSGRSQMQSPANSRLTLLNNGALDFDRLTFGPEAVTQSAIVTSPAIAGQAQGLIIKRGDGTAQAFVNLANAVNGAMIYCIDCKMTVFPPVLAGDVICAGGGSGSIAMRLNATWVCNGVN